MPWSNVFHVVIGTDCEWVEIPCNMFAPLFYFQDILVIPLLVLLAVGAIVCGRFLKKVLLAKGSPTSNQYLLDELLIAGVANRQKSNEELVQQIISDLK